MTSTQIAKIKGVFRNSNLIWFVITVVAFALVNFILNEVYVVGFAIFRYNPVISIPYMFFIITNTLLTGINFVLGFNRLRELGVIKMGGSVFSFIGAFVALLTGACPGCISGLLPAIAGVLGSNLNLNSFPLYGIEIQLLSTLLLLAGIYQLSKEVSCKLAGKL